MLHVVPTLTQHVHTVSVLPHIQVDVIFGTQVSDVYGRICPDGFIDLAARISVNSYLGPFISQVIKLTLTISFLLACIERFLPTE